MDTRSSLTHPSDCQERRWIKQNPASKSTLRAVVKMQDLLREKLLKLIWCGVQGAKLWRVWKTTQHLQKLYRLGQICKVSPKTLGRTKGFYISAAPSLALNSFHGDKS